MWGTLGRRDYRKWRIFCRYTGNDPLPDERGFTRIAANYFP